jgi:hypothetical protein
VLQQAWSSWAASEMMTCSSRSTRTKPSTLSQAQSSDGQFTVQTKRGQVSRSYLPTRPGRDRSRSRPQSFRRRYGQF